MTRAPPLAAFAAADSHLAQAASAGDQIAAGRLEGDQIDDGRLLSAVSSSSARRR
jgi:hypothetical protein